MVSPDYVTKLWEERSPHWLMEIHERIRWRQARCIANRGTDFGVAVHDDPDAKEWQRLNHMRLRVEVWINKRLNK